jgi:hypothetical protein
VNSPVTTVSPTMNTTYAVNGINMYGCIGTGTVMVVVNPNPVITATANSTSICSGDELLLSASGAANYNWVASTGGVYSGSAVSIRPLASANYVVTGTDNNGCSGTKSIVVAVNSCTGLLENNLANIEFFPNPVNEILNIRLADNASASIRINDVNGKLVYSDHSSSDKHEVNMSGLKSGVYTLVVSSDNAARTFKIVKMD